MERKWFYYLDGKEYGPFAAEKILSWVKAGRLNPTTLVWCDDMSRPKPLSEVPVFQDIQPSSKPPPLPSETSPSSREEPESATEEPLPLPSNKEDSEIENESPGSAAGAIQTDQDQKTANWMWRGSMITLAVLFFSSVIALLPWNDESGEDISVRQQKWPSAFDPDNRDNLIDPKSPSLNEDLAEDIGRAFGFRYGQNHTLNRIRREYSGTRIASEARLGRLRFNSRFGDAYDYIDNLFSQKWRTEWVQAKNRIEEQSAPLLGKDSISRAEAKAFIDTVENRSQGHLPSPILETLLMFTPEYIERPANMFDDGFTKEYRTGGHTKSKGIDVGIQYPASWKAEEGRRPHIVQKFTSENGYGSTMALLLVRAFPEEMPRNATESDFDKAILELDR